MNTKITLGRENTTLGAFMICMLPLALHALSIITLAGSTMIGIGIAFGIFAYAIN